MDSTLLIKDNLISRIKNSNDLKFLKALQSIFDSSEQELYEINNTQKQKISLSRKEITEGNFVENSIVIENAKQWLKKQ